MKQRLVLALLVVAVVGLWAGSALAQGAFGKVTGTCRDADGNPIVGATVRYYSKDTGQKYDIKTNSRGEYMSIGIAPAMVYKVTLIGKDGKEIDHVDNVNVATGDNDPIDFDVKKQQQDALKQNGYTPEQAKEMQKAIKEHDAAIAKESDTIKTLNEKVTAANEATKAGDYEAAITILTQASQVDANRDLIWYKLADAYTQSAAKQTDSDEKARRLDNAVSDYQKALDLKKADMQAAADKKVDAAKQADAAKNLAAYYNGLGNAYSKQNKTDAAVQAFNQAAQTDPSNAGMYYFNQGAIMTNGGHLDEAIAAFDKAIAADPNKASAYYWKGVNLMGKATLKDNKMVAPTGTAEAFNKYLELEPTGTYADAAKQMLASIGAAVETSFGKKKTTPTKK
jgi:tetratricopeptide (TPR) repeat protein